jgi:hypothetical protein
LSLQPFQDEHTIADSHMMEDLADLLEIRADDPKQQPPMDWPKTKPGQIISGKLSNI